MTVQLVELKGTFSRKDTPLYEARAFRTRFTMAVEQLGGEARIIIPRAQPDDGSAVGRFRIVLPMRHSSSGQRQLLKASKLTLQALLALYACRAPQFKVLDHSITTDHSLVGGLLS